MRIKNLTLALSLVVAVFATAKGLSPEITAEVKRQTIAGLEKAMSDGYAYPEIAKKAIASIDSHVKAHDYDGITDGKEFATRVTKDLRDVCHDAHLHISYSENVLPQRDKQGQPTPAQIKAEEDRLRYDNAGFSKVERLDGNIGYIRLQNFLDPELAKRPFKGAMEFLAATDALIFDIRENIGGDPATVQWLCSYFFGDKTVHLNDLVTRDGHHVEFWTKAKVDGPKYLGKDIYILTSKRTGSAAEEFAFDLQNLKRATIIGEPTWGGANPGRSIRLNDHFQAFVPFAHAENPYSHTNWEGAGVPPDVAVSPKDGLDVAQKMALEKLIGRSNDPDRKSNLQGILKELKERTPGSTN